MFEEDEGAYFLEFFSQGLGRNAVLSLFLAPIVPEWISQYALAGSVAIAAILCLAYAWAKPRLLNVSARGLGNSTVTTLISEESSTMFRVVGSTTLILMTVVLWLGFAKLLWVFESFFVLFATIHIASSVISTLMELAYLRGEIDDITNCIHGAQPSNDSDGSDKAE